jgi:hypothetical protein
MVLLFIIAIYLKMIIFSTQYTSFYIKTAVWRIQGLLLWILTPFFTSTQVNNILHNEEMKVPHNVVFSISNLIIIAHISTNLL